MNKITIAIPAATTEGLAGLRSDHFGHCPVFTLIEVENKMVTRVTSVVNVAHEAGGCMKPVGILADRKVDALVVAGIGRGPFQRLMEHGIAVYYADSGQFPDIRSAVEGFIADRLPMFSTGQLCTTGGGDCHH